MTDRSIQDLAPETVSPEQDDEPAQAQSVASDAIGRKSTGDGLSDSEKLADSGDDADLPDLVDHMNQMVSSGIIDNSAYRSERNDDDEEGLLGEAGVEE